MWSYLGRGRKYAVIVERRVVGTSCLIVIVHSSEVGVEGGGGGSGGGRMRSGVYGVRGDGFTCNDKELQVGVRVWDQYCCKCDVRFCR